MAQDNTSSNNNNNNNDDEKPPHMRLFDFDEEEIKELNYYQILGLDEPVRATPFAIKQAYRKASIKYHPDKTGRDEGDYVFIAVKNAWDTLSDVEKRKAYDSTEMPFDDTIPPDVATNTTTSSSSNGNNGLLYTDNDFYDTFGPVFERNLRFDTRLQQQTSRNKNTEIPALGDFDTPIEKVQAFYDYWTQFESWRDFSQKASEELFENNNPLEDAESRYEKRFYQKEIDKRAKALKRQEMNRIQTLVQRAMAADPRLRQYYQEQKEAKEKAALERKLKKEQEERQKKEEEERRQKEEAQRFEREKEQKAQEKAQREREKKVLRKVKQQLRKVTIAAFQEQTDQTSKDELPYSTLEGMSDEVEFLCQELSLMDLQALTDKFTESESFSLIQEQSQKQRLLKEGEKEAKAREMAEIEKKRLEEERRKAEQLAKSKEWTQEELTALGKAVKKFPGGGANRWEQIASYINSSCRPEDPKTKEECIEKYNQATKAAPPTTTAAAAAINTPAGGPPAKGATAAATTTPLTNGFVQKNSVNSAKNGTAAAATTNGAAAVAAAAKTTGTAAAAAAAATTKANENGAATTTTTSAAAAAASNSKPKVVSKSESTMTDASGDGGGGDVWSEEQDKLLQEALAKFPASMDKNERWTSIAKMVDGKSKKQCVQRFKAIRDAIKSKK